MAFIGNLLWFFFGWGFLAWALCITIIGIPFGLANFKIASVAFAPLGKVIASKEMAQAAKMRQANE